MLAKHGQNADKTAKMAWKSNQNPNPGICNRVNSQ